MILDKLTLSTVIEELTHIKNLHKWSDLTKEQQKWLEKVIGKEVKQKEYLNSKDQMTKQILSVWIKHSENTKIIFKR